MHTRSKGVGGLQPLDFEIERDVKQRRRENRAILQQQRVAMESTSQGVTRDTPEQEGEHHVLNPQNDPRRAPVQNDYQQVPIEEHDHTPPQVPSPRRQGMPPQGYQPPHEDPPLVDAPQRNPPHAPPPYHHPYPPHPPYHYGYYYPPGPPPQPQKLGAGIYEIDQTSALVAKLDSVVQMVQKFLFLRHTRYHPIMLMLILLAVRFVVVVMLQLIVIFLRSVHISAMVEHVDQVDYGDLLGHTKGSSPHQGNTHPGFSWSKPSGAANPTGVARGPPPGFQGQQGYKGNYQGTQQQWRPNQGYHGQSSYQGHQGGPSQYGYHGNQSHPPRATVEAPKGRSLEICFKLFKV
nr:uncharacterized protein LOC109169433 [Ipomoea batatas]